MTDKKIVIAALARDCADALNKNIPRLEELASYFGACNFVVVENDSRDATKDILQCWAKRNASVKVISQDFGSTTIDNMSYADPYPCFGRKRISKMARYRNIYLDYIKSNITDIDYLLIVDIDISNIDTKGFISSVENAPSDWGALFAYGKTSVSVCQCALFNLYWDTYAYVQVDTLEPTTLNHINTSHRRVAKLINKEHYHKCASAFGGMGIYKWECIKNNSYVMEENNDVNVKAKCEHIPFHRAIAQDYGLYVSKTMVIDYGNTSLFKYVLRTILPASVRVFISKIVRR